MNPFFIYHLSNFVKTPKNYTFALWRDLWTNIIGENMMKRMLLIGLVLLLTSQVLFSQNNGYVVSQNNGFIVKRYSPALIVSKLTLSNGVATHGERGSEHLGWYQIALNIDDDEEADIRFRNYTYEQREHSIGVERGTDGLPYHYNYGHYGKNTSEIDSIHWKRYFRFYGSNDFLYFAVRKQVGNDYYYGWVFAYIYVKKLNKADFQIISSAMCTVPNRHIFLGQIDINEDFPTLGDEASDDVWYFCQGSYTFLRCSKSQQFTSVEVYDTRGVRVNLIEDFNSPGKDWVDIGLESHPAGLYLARYRLDDGSEGCVKIIHTR